MRKPFIAANWKMHKNVQESVEFVDAIKGKLPDPQEVEVGIAAQAFALPSMVQAADDSGLKIIAQNAAAEYSGAFTGEIHYVFQQLMSVLRGVSLDQIKNVVVSYEPSWAVGYGQHANPVLAEEGCRQIRRTIADNYTYEIADKIRILYGGSVNPDNIGMIMNKPDVDGVLIGRASLDVDNFLRMVNYLKKDQEK